MEVSKELCNKISAEIKEAVDVIIAKHGLATGNMKTMYGTSYKFTIEAFAVKKGANDVNTASAEAQSWAVSGGWAIGEAMSDEEELKNSGKKDQLAGVTFFGNIATEDQLIKMLGTKFSYGGRNWIFNGINTRKKKNTVAATDADDLKRYWLPSRSLLTMVEASGVELKVKN